jgi:methyl-accepting chemotaxis protein
MHIMKNVRNMKIEAKIVVIFICLSVISEFTGYFVHMRTNSDMAYILVILGSTLLMAAIFWVLMTRSVKKPIDEIQSVLGKLSANDLTAGIRGTYTGTFDELAKQVNILQTRLLNVQDAFECVGRGESGRLEEFETIGKRSENDRLLPALTAALKAIRGIVSETEFIADAATNGDLSVRGNKSKFEGGYYEIIDSLNHTMEAIIKPINEASSVMEEMAHGNLTVSMNGDYKGDYAKIKTNLNSTLKSFNEVLKDINSSALQVAIGSKQMSDSAQDLSKGATEQASSIEELSATTEEITIQTKLNAENAGQANKIALEAKEGAEAGNGHMKEMLKSMYEINEASSNISKIIKVIDDIAFQTNILALNAAVEAARAGQQGKGFAVVAEEVRSLAARSASAAKETTVLIESSIKKTEEGTKIASKTADDLNKIVEGIARAASLVGDIASASDEQAVGIQQVNQGIMQVSQVVQMNSATAEESAAASEELSSQAELLKELVSKFQLKQTRDPINMLEGLDADVIRMLENMTDKKRSSAMAAAGVKSEASASNSKLSSYDKSSDYEYGKY